MSEHSISMHPSGPPRTVLPPESDAVDEALRQALAAPADDRRPLVAQGRRRQPAVAQRVGGAGQPRPRRDRALRGVSRRLPPRPRRAARQRMARIRLRALGRRDQPGISALPARAAADGRGHRTNATKPSASPCSSSNSIPAAFLPKGDLGERSCTRSSHINTPNDLGNL